jgi:hypothetical protein
MSSSMEAKPTINVVNNFYFFEKLQNQCSQNFITFSKNFQNAITNFIQKSQNNLKF